MEVALFHRVRLPDDKGICITVMWSRHSRFRVRTYNTAWRSSPAEILDKLFSSWFSSWLRTHKQTWNMVCVRGPLFSELC